MEATVSYIDVERITGKKPDWIARYAFPDGSTVRCLPCGIQRSCTTSEIAEWIQSGFPKCRNCGHTVDLINPWVKEN
jgi:hypothetical protein